MSSVCMICNSVLLDWSSLIQMQLAYSFRFHEEATNMDGVVQVSSRFQGRYLSPSEVCDLSRPSSLIRRRFGVAVIQLLRKQYPNWDPNAHIGMHLPVEHIDLSLLSDEYVRYLTSLGWVVSRALYSRPEINGPCLVEIGIARTRVLTDTTLHYATYTRFLEQKYLTDDEKADFRHLCAIEADQLEIQLSDFFTEWHFSHEEVGLSYCERPHLSLAIPDDEAAHGMFNHVLSGFFSKN